MHRALNLNSGDAPSQLQEGGGETNEMNAIIKVDGQTERGKPQRNEEKKQVGELRRVAIVLFSLV